MAPAPKMTKRIPAAYDGRGVGGAQVVPLAGSAARARASLHRDELVEAIGGLARDDGGGHAAQRPLLGGQPLGPAAHLEQEALAHHDGDAEQMNAGAATTSVAALWRSAPPTRVLASAATQARKYAAAAGGLKK